MLPVIFLYSRLTDSIEVSRQQIKTVRPIVQDAKPFSLNRKIEEKQEETDGNKE